MAGMTRAGRLPGLVLLVLLGASAITAEAKSYLAERFDSRVEVLRGGSLRVTETIVFRFESGTFSEVFREIPSRNADRVEFVGAALDGAPLPEGKGAGQVEVRRRSRLRVTWRFAPTSGTRRTFELTYLLHGAIQEAGDADLLALRALPGEHSYRIASSTMDVMLPAPPLATPALTSRKTGQAAATVDGSRVRVAAGGIRSNGWIELRVRLPRGSAIDAPPAWQQRQHHRRTMAPKWMVAAGATLLCGLVLLFAVHQRYDSPPRDASMASAGPGVPDALGPAEAGALVANGTPRMEHAMAALFALAERGELTIDEEPKGFLGQRRFVLTRTPARRPVTAYEQAVLDVVFNDGGQAEPSVPLDKARSRLMRHSGRISQPLAAELKAEGLIDDGRKAVRERYLRIGVGLLVIAAIAAAPVAYFTLREYGAWPLLVPLALGVVGLLALIGSSAHTPLSNEGIRRARYWRAFRHYLEDVARDRRPAPADDPTRLLPFAVALGLADAWSKYLAKHRAAIPAWFRAAMHGDSAPAFVEFVAHGGAAHTSGASGSGAAGGGASGAR